MMHLVTKKYFVKLSCGHTATTDVDLVLVFPRDQNFVRCPSCRHIFEGLTELDPMSIATAWNEVTSVISMPDMPIRTAPVVCCDILRLQPSQPPHRRQYPKAYCNHK